MRIVKEIQHLQCKITIFYWNNRYLIKLEQGLLEQTYKINAFDLMSEHDIDLIVDNHKFMEGCLKRFQEMGESLHDAMQST